jgi:hypothetical protein
MARVMPSIHGCMVSPGWVVSDQAMMAQQASCEQYLP